MEFDFTEQKRSGSEGPEEEEEVVEWFVEKIYAKRISKESRKPEYRVKWKDWASEHDTWEPLSHLGGSKALVVDFEKQEAKKVDKVAAAGTKEKTRLKPENHKAVKQPFTSLGRSTGRDRKPVQRLDPNKVGPQWGGSRILGAKKVKARSTKKSTDTTNGKKKKKKQHWASPKKQLSPNHVDGSENEGLFVRPDGSPMVFMFVPSTGARCKELRPLIESNGGKIVSMTQPGVYRLVGRAFMVESINPREPLFRDEFVGACVHANTNVDINLYQVVGSPKKVAPIKNKHKRLHYTLEKDLLIANAYKWYWNKGNQTKRKIFAMIYEDLMDTPVGEHTLMSMTDHYNKHIAHCIEGNFLVADGLKHRLKPSGETPGQFARVASPTHSDDVEDPSQEEQGDDSDIESVEGEIPGDGSDDDNDSMSAVITGEEMDGKEKADTNTTCDEDETQPPEIAGVRSPGQLISLPGNSAPVYDANSSSSDDEFDKQLVQKLSQNTESVIISRKQNVGGDAVDAAADDVGITVKGETVEAPVPAPKRRRTETAAADGVPPLAAAMAPKSLTKSKADATDTVTVSTKAMLGLYSGPSDVQRSLNSAVEWIGAQGWDTKDVWNALYLMSGNVVEALSHLEGKTDSPAPWTAKDSAAMMVESDEGEGDIDVDRRLNTKYGEDRVKNRFKFLDDDADPAYDE